MEPGPQSHPTDGGEMGVQTPLISHCWCCQQGRKVLPWAPCFCLVRGYKPDYPLCLCRFSSCGRGKCLPYPSFLLSTSGGHDTRFPLSSSSQIGASLDHPALLAREKKKPALASWSLATVTIVGLENATLGYVPPPSKGPGI